MKARILTPLFLLLISFILQAQDNFDCFSVLVGKEATTDGSVIRPSLHGAVDVISPESPTHRIDPIASVLGTGFRGLLMERSAVKSPYLTLARIRLRFDKLGQDSTKHAHAVQTPEFFPSASLSK